MRDLARLSVLVVEDNELDSRSICRTLGNDEETDFRVLRVVSLAQAVLAMETDTFDCVLLDLSLPDSEGLIALDTVMSSSGATPTVVLTGLDDPRTALEAVDRGAEDYLIKNRVSGDVIARSIRYAVARHHTDSALRTATDLLRVAQDRERIGRDLHDTVVQQLFATGMGLQALIGRTEDHAIRDGLVVAVENIDDSIRELRQAIFDLHLATDDATLANEIEDLVSRIEPSLGFRPAIRIGDISELSAELRHDILAVVGEGLSNVSRHAGATAAEIIVEALGQGITISISDNGRGLDSPKTANGDTVGNGLRNMEERAVKLSGTFRIGPGPGGGSRIEWTVPRNPR